MEEKRLQCNRKIRLSIMVTSRKENSRQEKKPWPRSSDVPVMSECPYTVFLSSLACLLEGQ